MANPFINARESLLFLNVTDDIDTPGDEITVANFKPVACLTSVDFNGSTSGISATSKCSDSGFAESVAGEKSWTMSAEGLAQALEAGDLRIDHNLLYKQWRSGAAAWWMIADRTPALTNVTIRYGVGRIDTESDSFPDNAAQTFSTSITGIGASYDQDDLAAVTP